MKRSFIFSLIIIGFALSSCYYEEGPFFSFRSAEGRIINKWRYQKVTMNGQDMTSNYSARWAEFYSDFTAKFHNGTNDEYNADWTLSEDEKTLYLDCINDSGLTWSEEYAIFKLKEKEMWLQGDFGSVTMKIQYVKY